MGNRGRTWSNEEEHEPERYHVKSSTYLPEGVPVGTVLPVASLDLSAGARWPKHRCWSCSRWLELASDTEI